VAALHVKPLLVPLPTTNKPVKTPLEIKHVVGGVGSITLLDIEHEVSVDEKPVPITATGNPG
jgi:hypothetical protein